MSNILDYSLGLEQVRYVLSMEGAADTPGIAWRRITSPIIVTFGFAVIYLSKLLTGVLYMYCGVQMFKSRKADAETFDAAKRWGILGCGIGVVMLFLGFIVIADEYFEYWRVETLGMITHHYAFIYTMCLMSFLLFLQSPEKQPK